MVEKHTDYNLGEIDIVTIMERIPHRYPMLMVDKMAEIRPYESAVAIKNVTASEPHFQGHFPRKPVMPGVLIIESMAQTAAVMVVSSLGKESEGKLVYFMSVDNAKFRHPVVPGDQMFIHVHKVQQRGSVWRFSGEAKVDGKRVAQADFSAMIRDD